MYKYPIVSSWDEFESLCLMLFKEMWNCPNAHKNGRQGQEQKGVDIYGKPAWKDEIYGVQCKHKQYDKKLTIREIKAECEKAKSFDEHLTLLYFATTDSQDSSLQESVRNLNNQKKYNFEIQIYSWNDIEEDLNSRPSIVKRFYREIYYSSEYEAKETQVIMPRFNAKNNFYPFFYRESVRSNISEPVLRDIISLMYELSDNCYTHGHANQVKISRDGNKFILEDDGKEFNPIQQLKGDYTLTEKMGSGFFQDFLSKYKDKIEFNYKYERGKNIFILSISDFNILLSGTTYQEVIINFEDIFGRKEAKHFANANEINPEVQEVILDIVKLPSLSAGGSLISYYEKNLGKNQKLIVYLPRNAGPFFTHLTADERIVFKIR